MADKTLNVRVKNKADTSANWTSKNPVLLDGEIGVESDTYNIKIGDGVTSWNNLDYFTSAPTYEVMTEAEIDDIFDGVQEGDTDNPSVYMEVVDEAAANAVAAITPQMTTDITNAVTENVIADVEAIDSRVSTLESSQPHTVLKRNTAYAVGDVVYSADLPSWAYLECITAGTTGAEAPEELGGAVS